MAIPSLTFDYFKGFHQRFYHPGNSRVYFYGDDPPLKVSLLHIFLRKLRSAPLYFASTG